MTRRAVIKKHSSSIEFVQFDGTNKTEVDKFLGVETTKHPDATPIIYTRMFTNRTPTQRDMVVRIAKGEFVCKYPTEYENDEVIMSFHPEEFLSLYKIEES